MYENVQVKSALVRVIEDRMSLNLSTVNFLTYDTVNKKFMSITLEQPVRNVAIYDDRIQIMPKTMNDAPKIDEIDSLRSFQMSSLSMLLWTNQRRF